MSTMNQIENFVNCWMLHSDHGSTETTPTLQNLTLVEFCNDADLYRIQGHYASLKTKWGLLYASLSLGTIIGGFILAPFADKFGRVWTMTACGILTSIGTILQFVATFTTSYALMIFARILSGINVGCGLLIAPIYLVEIAPKHMVRSFGASYRIGCNMGTLLMLIFGLQPILATPSRWRYLILINLPSTILQSLAFITTVESPDYYLLQGDRARASEANLALHGIPLEIDRSQYQDVVSTQNIFKRYTSSINALVNDRSALKMCMLLTVLGPIGVTLSGVVTIPSYSYGIFQGIGLDPLWAGLGSVMVVLSCTVTSILVMVTGIHDKHGRRLWYLISVAGTALLLFTVFGLQFGSGRQFSWAILGLTVLTLCFANLGLFTIPPSLLNWVPVEHRTTISAIRTMVGSCMFFAIMFGFPPLSQAIGHYVFLTFGVTSSLVFLYAFFRLVDEKGKTVEEVRSEFETRNQKCLYL